MPQIDLVAYLAQYVWTLISLLLLYACVVLKILPRIQQHLALRVQAEGTNKDWRSVSASERICSKGTRVLRSLLNFF